MTGSIFSAELRAVARELERIRWAVVLCDTRWRLCWVSPEQKRLLHEDDDELLGVGEHLLAAFQREAWLRSATAESMIPELKRALPFLLEGLDTAERERLWPGPEADDALPPEFPPVNTGTFDYVAPNLPPSPISYLGLGIATGAGRRIGSVVLFSSGLRASVQDLLVRGDEATFERMTELLEPRREAAAVLFADLQSSTRLSREMSSAGYFRVLRQLLRVIDAAVVTRAGLVSKHPGDGVVAFFRAADAGSASAAASAALECARALRAEVERTAVEMSADLPITAADCVVNIGVHYGEGIYLGQIVTGGRLEVTGLGEEVSITSRLQQATCDGGVLVSKALLERLGTTDAGTLGLEVDRLRYTVLGGLPGVPDKARRDAGELAVADLREWANAKPG